MQATHCICEGMCERLLPPSSVCGAGNMLVRPVRSKGSDPSGLPALGQPAYELIPIDHGFALPEAFEPPYFEWQHWPQVGAAGGAGRSRALVLVGAWAEGCSLRMGLEPARGKGPWQRSSAVCWLAGCRARPWCEKPLHAPLRLPALRRPCCPLAARSWTTLRAWT